jgi:hypothetical protein
VLSSASVKVGCFGNVEEGSAAGLSEALELMLNRSPKFRYDSVCGTITRCASIPPENNMRVLVRR